MEDRHSFMEDRRFLLDDRHFLPAERRSLPADRHSFMEDRRLLTVDRHSFMDDRRLLMDDRHSLPEDRRSLPEDRRFLSEDCRFLLADDVYEASFKKHYVEAIVSYGRILGSSLFSVDWKKTQGALSGPGGANEGSRWEATTVRRAHPPVSPMTPRAPAGRMTAHDGGSCRHFMRPAGARKTLP